MSTHWGGLWAGWAINPRVQKLAARSKVTTAGSKVSTDGAIWRDSRHVANASWVKKLALVSQNTASWCIEVPANVSLVIWFYGINNLWMAKLALVSEATPARGCKMPTDPPLLGDLVLCDVSRMQKLALLTSLAACGRDVMAAYRSFTLVVGHVAFRVQEETVHPKVAAPW